MIRLFACLTVLGLFVWFCHYAWHAHPPTHSAKITEGEFIGQKLAEYDPADAGLVSRPAPAKTVYVWRDKKAAQLAAVWNLTPETLDGAADVLGRLK